MSNDKNQPNTSEQSAHNAINELFGDKDGNGIPDVLEGRLTSADLQNFFSQRTQKITIDGTEYTKWDDIPEEQRQRVMQGMQSLTKMASTAGGIMKGIGLFSLIKRLMRRKPMYAATQTHYAETARPSYAGSREDSSSPFAKLLRWLMISIAIGAVVYYFIQR